MKKYFFHFKMITHSLTAHKINCSLENRFLMYEKKKVNFPKNCSSKNSVLQEKEGMRCCFLVNKKEILITLPLNKYSECTKRQ